jgi:hypothetical protein
VAHHALPDREHEKTPAEDYSAATFFGTIVVGTGLGNPQLVPSVTLTCSSRQLGLPGRKIVHVGVGQVARAAFHRDITTMALPPLVDRRASKGVPVPL